jgi:plastocyanin
MKLTDVRSVAVALAICAAAACGGSGSEPKTTPPPDAPRVDASKAGALTGRILFDGPAPQNPPIKMAADPACASANPNGAISEAIRVADGGLDNVFVYVKDGLGRYYFDLPTEPVTLDQQGCRYHPHILGIRVGQPLQIVNSDATMHNVHAMAQVNQEFNASQAIQGMKTSRTFDKPEVMVHFKCDVHSWMSADVGVMAHPYFAVSAGGGKFELKNLPAGTYTIEAWHEKLGTQTQQVTLGEKETKDVSFTFKPAAS